VSSPREKEKNKAGSEEAKVEKTTSASAFELEGLRTLVEANGEKMKKLIQKVDAFSEEEVPTAGNGGEQPQMQAQLLASTRSAAAGHPLTGGLLHAGQAASLTQGLRHMGQEVLILQEAVDGHAALLAQLVPQMRKQ